MSESEHKGHRQRLRQKVLTGLCCEHEYLEMLLCYAIPRRNTNDLAHRLLAAFGSLPAVLSAPVAQLQTVQGVGVEAAALLCCVGKCCKDYASTVTKTNGLPEIYERRSFTSFIPTRYEGLKTEVFDVYLMDGAGKIFRHERFDSKQIGAVYVNTEAFTALLVAAQPSGVVIVHNHPFGLPEPSEKDNQTTRLCGDICRLQNVLLCNHFIYAPKGVYDYYGSGKLMELLGAGIGGLEE